MKGNIPTVKIGRGIAKKKGGVILQSHKSTKNHVPRCAIYLCLPSAWAKHRETLSLCQSDAKRKNPAWLCLCCYCPRGLGKLAQAASWDLSLMLNYIYIYTHTYTCRHIALCADGHRVRFALHKEQPLRKTV